MKPIKHFCRMDGRNVDILVSFTIGIRNMYAISAERNGKNKMPRNNFIQRLQNENEEYELKRQNALNEIMHMRIYLTSNKFWDDTTIQVKDVL